MQLPVIFTLFGSTGDLAQKKIMPALLHLFADKRLPEKFAVVAYSRRTWTDEEHRDFLRPILAEHPKAHLLEDFLKRVVYAEGKIQEERGYINLHGTIKKLEEKIGTAQKFFYFAVRPEFYHSILQGIHVAGLLNEPSTRILVEKPFGNDEASARKLEADFESMVRPEQLLKVDHYLAKDGVREIVEARKSDTAFESKLHKGEVASVEVSIFEKSGINGRGEFYDRIGALKDVGQNHLLEMLAVLIMDINPAKHGQENEARTEALQSLEISSETILGQYEGYLEEKNVLPFSKTETYFKIRAESTLPKWQGVSIILEAGKSMSERKGEVAVNFKDGSKRVFNIQHSPSGRDAYEVLIEGAILGNCQCFASFAEISASWRFLEPIFEKRDTLEVKTYPKGANGPNI